MSRLWDAVGGFLFLFAHLQEKLSKNASQVWHVYIKIVNQSKIQRLTFWKRSSICKLTWSSCCSQCLRVRIILLKIIKYYADATGNVLNGTIGKQMVDTLVESTSNVEVHTLLTIKSLTCSYFHFLPSWSCSQLYISCPVLFVIRTRSVEIKHECLQLILNYFKLFLLLPGEEVRNLRPSYILCQPKAPYISCVNPKHVLVWKTLITTALFLPLVAHNLSCPRYMFLKSLSLAMYIARVIPLWILNTISKKLWQL